MRLALMVAVVMVAYGLVIPLFPTIIESMGGSGRQGQEKKDERDRTGEGGRAGPEVQNVPVEKRGEDYAGKGRN